MSAPARAAVIGSPIAHSLSPALHRAAYSHLGIDADYTAIEVTESAFGAFLEALRTDRKRRWLGLSVTMPLKRVAAQRADWLDENTHLIGVANTLMFDGDASSPNAGTIRAHNFDIHGIVRSLEHVGVKRVDSCLILGGGGTALAALAASHRLGASSIELALRDVAKATELTDLAARLGTSLTVSPLTPDILATHSRGEPGPKSGGHAVVLSTLPARAADPLSHHVPEHPGVLLDVAYDPWPSELARAFAQAGGSVVSGKEMLLYQAIEQVRVFGRLDGAVPASAINAMCDAIGIPRREG